MAKICTFRSATNCGFLEKTLKPCPACPFNEAEAQAKAGERGEAGQPGSQGATGLPGGQGATGKQGDLGERGLIGSIGLTGSPGLDGLRGLPGQPGDRGPRGDPGEVDEAKLSKLVAAALKKAGGGQVVLGWGAREKFTQTVADARYAKKGAVGGGREIHITLAHSAEGISFSS